MNLAIKKASKARGITRLCHLTPSRNLVHIATDPSGILDSKSLAGDDAATFNPVDQERLDGFLDHVCCSIQYPNAWYLRNVRHKDKVFHDWVILLIEPDYLWGQGTKFSPRNAAASHGSYVKDGIKGFQRLYAEKSAGSGGHIYSRGINHPDFLPTDEQAEVLVPSPIPRSDIIGVVVPDKSQAKREIARLEALGVQLRRFLIAPELFDPVQLSSTLRSGNLPSEVEHDEE